MAEGQSAWAGERGERSALTRDGGWRWWGGGDGAGSRSGKGSERGMTRGRAKARARREVGACCSPEA